MAKRSISYILSALILTMLGSGMVYADWMKKGDNAWASGEIDTAISHYNKAAKALSGSQKGQAYFNKGLGFFQRGHWDGALDAFESAQDHVTSSKKQELYYYMGLCYYAKNSRKKSIEQFSNALKYNTSSVVSERAGTMLNRAKAQKDKKFSAFTSLGWGYSDNVPFFRGGVTPRDTEVKSKQDHAFNFSLKPQYAFLIGERSKILVNFSSFTNRNLDESLRHYDVYQNSIGTNIKVPWSFFNTELQMNFPMEIGAVFTGVRRNDGSDNKNEGNFDQISNYLSFTPSYHFFYTSWTDTKVNWLVGVNDFKEGQGGVNNQDDFTFGGGVEQIFHNSLFDFNLGYHYTAANAEGSGFNRRDNKLSAGFEANFFFRTKFSGNASFTASKFVDHTLERKDNLVSVSSSLVKVFDNLVGTSLNIAYRKNTAKPATTAYEAYSYGLNAFYNFN